MTGQTGSQETFTARADAAATALKGQMNLPPKPVAVGPDGQPPRPLPPKGSYARQAIEQQQAALREQASYASSQAPAPLNGNGQAAHEATETAAEEAQEEALSVNATRRFAELTGQLRERERALGELSNRSRSQDDELAKLRTDLEQMRQANEKLMSDHRRLLESSLDGLDPETRATVLMESKIQDLLQEQERRLLTQFDTQLQRLRVRTEEDDYQKLGGKYRNFDIQVHKPLIEMFRTQNPASSIEQAYKAVAEPNELVLNGSSLAPNVPPVLAPGPGPTAEALVPRPRPDPNTKMVEDARRIKELMSSNDPKDHREGRRLAEKNIRDRYFGG